MSLADEIAWALPELQAEAEARMVDTCRITSTNAPEWDEDSGTYKPGPDVVVYEGKCRVRNANPAPQQVMSGEAAYAVDIFTLSLPLVGSEAVTDGMTVTITASANDPGAVGTVLSIIGPHVQTDSTARRFPVRSVSRDA